ncbi:telomerase inhibitor [Aspergillus terreus]
MGLAAPRKRTKISHDPNNTNWARSTSGFGHKILSSQGWTPGSFLGARDAAHADMFTAASAGHIRVVVKDDTLGLGARAGRDPNEPTGLDAFKGLLGRLNGKSDAELAADQRKADDIKLARYAAFKWQAVRFVSGGLLAQEKLERLPERESVQQSRAAVETSDSNRNSENDASKSSRSEKRREKKEKKDKKEKKEKKDKKDKKRKRAEEDNDASQKSASETPAPEKESTGLESDSTSVSVVKASRERRPLGRQIVRGRHIAQKKRALMDDKSLNEIFMVKA